MRCRNESKHHQRHETRSHQGLMVGVFPLPVLCRRRESGLHSAPVIVYIRRDPVPTPAVMHRYITRPTVAIPGSVKPRVMTPQSSANFPKTHLKTAENSAKHYKKQVMRAVFALAIPGSGHVCPLCLSNYVPRSRYMFTFGPISFASSGLETPFNFMYFII